MPEIIIAPRISAISLEFASFIKSQYKEATSALIQEPVIMEARGIATGRSVLARKSRAIKKDRGMYRARSV